MGSNLTEKQEILLCRLFDGDLGIINRYRASRLTKRCREAQDFLHNLESISSAVSSSPEHSSNQVSCDLWDRISQRISAEEHASVFLGARTSHTAHSAQNNHQNWYSFFSTQALLGGFSGAATTALVLLVVSSYKTNSPQTGSVSTASNSSGAQVFTQANLSNNGFENSRTSVAAPFSAASTASRPLLLQERGNSVMEVDWMRGDGPLRVIQNPSEKSTIIWVKRPNQNKKPALRGNSQITRSSSMPQLVVTNAPVYGGSSIATSNR